MSAANQFKLPDVGEGLTEAEIVTWRVKPGDTVKVNDIIVEIETAKSLVELPCPWAGTVTELLVGEGDTVAVGTPIIAVATGDTAAAASTASTAAEAVPTPPAEGAVEPGIEGSPAPAERNPTLVGPGPRATTGKRRARKPVAGVPQSRSAAAAQTGVQFAFHPETTPEPAVSVEDAEPAAAAVSVAPAAGATGSVRALAKPPVRKLAKDLGVDLVAVTATGEGGVITRQDVESHAAGAAGRTGGAVSAEPSAAPTVVPLHRGQRETRIPVKGVRKMTAQAMVSSAFTAPHVTEWITIDATRTVRFVERLRTHREFRDVKVSPLLVVARAVCLAVRRTPEVNATWDEAAQEIVRKHYVNLGIAAATPRGLVVPNIKDADQLSLRELAGALGELTTTAREGKTQPGDMQGGSFTITNVGVFGVDAGTPIINPGESAILCMGAIRQQPWVHKGRIKARWVTQLALSFDHRIVDGEQGSRYLADVAAIVEDPATALLH
ncbi:MAG TPA: dihydrolipoamide acetyltransferase family protein [Nocardioidaceae bacterium]|nr:dihydrolipoamide acetyltransferase family protein [Nocardioidaceae bacterium]